MEKIVLILFNIDQIIILLIIITGHNDYIGHTIRCTTVHILGLMQPVVRPWLKLPRAC